MANTTLDHPSGPLEWPFPIEWDKTEEIDTDVLVIGGGASGCFAAMGAASRRRGRDFAWSDDPRNTPVAVVNEALSRQLRPAADGPRSLLTAPPSDGYYSNSHLNI